MATDGGKREMVQLVTPTTKLLATFQSLQSTVNDLLTAILDEDYQAILDDLGVVGGSQVELRDWAIQRCLNSAPSRDWKEEELATLGEEILPRDKLLLDALPKLQLPLRPPQPTRQFSEFLSTSHLHTSSLRLIYLPYVLKLTFKHVPRIPEDWKWKFWIGRGMNAADVVEGIIDELGLQRLGSSAGKTERFEYILSIDGGSDVAPATTLLPYLEGISSKSPHTIIFTLSTACSTRIGTGRDVGGPRVVVPKAVGDEGSAWRPTSIFGGIWGGSKVSEEPTGMEGDGEEEEPAERTIKGISDRLVETQGRSLSTTARLSTLFNDWMAPESAEAGSSQAASSNRQRIVSEPLAIVDPTELPQRFMSLTNEMRSRALASGISEGEDEDGGNDELEGEDLDRSLESLMDELGIKGPQRVIMRELTPDRKRFLIAQHQQSSTPRSTPLRPSKTGPASTSSDYGALAGLKRFSLVGAWGGSDDNATPTKANRPLTSYDTRSSIESSPTNDSLRSDEGSVVSSPTIGQGETASGWTSWWSAASNATGTGQVVGEQSKDTPQFYVDQLRSSKISQRSLVKHLIALRVRLSTAKLSWAQAFLGAAKGLDALEALLGKITLKRVNRGEVQTDEDETVQTECVKCLRVLLNTEIGFEQVLAHSTLITYISYCLFTTSHKLRSQVADVLAALCILSLQDGHSVVLAALSDFRVAHDEKFRFSYLVDSIRLRDSEGEEEEEGWWEYRTAAMSLINAITNSPEEVEERVMLRDEFGRRGLNEVMAGLRYLNPPDYLLTQLSVYIEERQEDQDELHDRALNSASKGAKDLVPRELVNLLEDHPDLSLSLVEFAQRFVDVFSRDLDPIFRENLSKVVLNFLEHAATLDDFEAGWSTFLDRYLSSIEGIVGSQASTVRSSRSEVGSEDKKERMEPTRRIDSLIEEIANSKTRISELELSVETRDKELKYLKRALESVYSRFQASALSSPSSPAPIRPNSAFDVDSMTNMSIEALAHRDEEIATLRKELGIAKAEMAAQRRLPMAFARTAPPPPPTAAKRKVSPLSTSSTAPVPPTSSKIIDGPVAPPPPPPPPPPPLPPLPTRSTTPSSIPAFRITTPSVRPPLPFLAGISRKSPSTSSDSATPPPDPVDPAMPSPPIARPPLPFLAGISNQPPSSSFVPPPPSPPPPPPPPPQVPKISVGSFEVTSRPRLPFLAGISSVPSSNSSSPPPPPPPPPFGKLIRSAEPSGIPPSPPPPSTNGPTPRLRRSTIRIPEKKLKPFFWNKLATQSTLPSVWTDLDSIPSSTLNLDDLVADFAVGSPAISKVSAGSGEKKKAVVSLLGLSRANNIAIMLARYKMSHSKIKDAVLQLDDGKLSIDNLKALKQYVPLTEEMEAIKAFEGDLSTLAPSDQYFNEIMVIPRLGERLHCMITRRRLEMDMEELKPELSILRCAADELKNSVRFKKLLGTVLAIGNTLNGGTFRGDAEGFRLESLLKLRETRAVNASVATPTLLHYLVRVIHRTDPTLLRFLDEARNVEAASRVSFSTVMGSVNSLVTSVAQVKEEVRVLKRIRISPPHDRFTDLMDPFEKHASPAIEALKSMALRLDEDLRTLLQYYGEEPGSSKPEDLFETVVAFSSALLRAETEVKLADQKSSPPARSSLTVTPLLPKSTSSPSKPKLSKTSIGRGGFDDAIRDLRSGIGARRQRSQAHARPLSRVFLDGTR